jgi:hypothetical protein
MMGKLKLTLDEILESYVKFRDRGKCHRLINQTATTFKFEGVKAAIPLYDISFTIGALDIDKKQLIDTYSPIALIVDNYQFTLCNNLKDPSFTKGMDLERLTQLRNDFIAAQGALALYSVTFEAFRNFPDRLKADFDESFDLLLKCFQKIVTRAQTENEEQERKRVVSRILSSLGVEEKDLDRVQLVAYASEYHNRVWSRDNIEGQITNDIRNLRSRLIDLIAQNGLNPQLPHGNNSAILDIADVLMGHGIIWGTGRGREFARVITDIENRIVARNERITLKEFDHGEYRNAILWFESEFQRIEQEQRQRRNQQQ